MKSFIEFIVEQYSKPTFISAIPSHGSHAIKKQKIQEHFMGYKKPDDSWFKHNENKHLGETQREVHKTLHMDEDKFLKHVGGADNHSHLHDYTDESYGINSALAKKKETKWDHAVIHGIDHATNHLLDHELHVYHGLDTWDPGKEAAKNKHGLIHIPTFLSTSTSKLEAHKFSKMRGEHHDETPKEINNGHILHIHLKKNNKGLYVGTHSAQSNITGYNEHEFLMPRDTVLKVHPQHTELNDGTKVWHATVHQHLEPRKLGHNP